MKSHEEKQYTERLHNTSKYEQIITTSLSEFSEDSAATISTVTCILILNNKGQLNKGDSQLTGTASRFPRSKD